MTYAELIGGLFPRLTGGVRWGLERSARLLHGVDDPQHRFDSIHIGGTNGKGSVSANLAALLGAAGRRVGLYTSPHLCTFRERIQVGGVPVSEEAITEAAALLWPAIEREDASFFEATTALAFLIFALSEVEIGVIEVGLGGRLDATNLIDPALVVLTNVALDHSDYLGTGLESVAMEKAGIIKPGVPVITGESDPEIIELFRSRAEEVGAPFEVLSPGAVELISIDEGGTTFIYSSEHWGRLDLTTPLIGEHQAWNAALAIRALEILGPERSLSRGEIVEAIGSVRWPGRLQWEVIDGVDWLFDVAHNPMGVEALCGAMEILPVQRPITALIGIMRDKDWEGMLELLLEVADEVVLTAPESAPVERAWDPVAVAGVVSAAHHVEAIPNFSQALERVVSIRERGGREGGTILVTGSFHTVGDALALLGRAPFGSDPALPSPIAGV